MELDFFNFLNINLINLILFLSFKEINLTSNNEGLFF